MIRNPDPLNGIDEAYQTILARLRSILVQWRLLTFSQNFLCWLSVIIISFSINTNLIYVCVYLSTYFFVYDFYDFIQEVYL